MRRRRNRVSKKLSNYESRRTDSLGRSIGPPGWYKRKKRELGYGRDCECNVDEVTIIKSENFPSYSDGLGRAYLAKCPECGERFVYDRIIVEG